MEPKFSNNGLIYYAHKEIADIVGLKFKTFKDGQKKSNSLLVEFSLSGFVSKDSIPAWLMYPLSIFILFAPIPSKTTRALHQYAHPYFPQSNHP
jgi:hypothetical protein